MTHCPSVCTYRVIFSDGTIIHPQLPGHVNAWSIAKQYAKETLSKGKDEPVTVVSVEFMY